MEEKLTFNVKGGKFSYLEIANAFHSIIGVTGTLKMNAKKRMLIKKHLSIELFTLVPSVFEESDRTFDKISDFEIHTEKDNYFEAITKRIMDAFDKNRAIIVFFDSEKCMEEYKKFKNTFSRTETKKLTDRFPDDKEDKNRRQSYISTAGNCKSVMYATKDMGRGIDFLCKDKTVLDNGGILIIQTFLSVEKSEEIQIQGRCARKGQKGGYCLILYLEDLEKFEIKNSQLKYKEAAKKRKSFNTKQFNELENKAEELKQAHKKSIELKELLKERRKEEVDKRLEELNIQNIPKVGTLILIDGTETMGNIIKGLKENMKNIFFDLDKTLSENNLPIGIISIQIAIYRDYDCGLDGILECSEWKTNPTELISFLEKIQAKGGKDIPEAVEIGLWYANTLAEKGQDRVGPELKQIILIADAPAKAKEKIIKDRKKNGMEEMWQGKFGLPTDWIEQAKILKNRSIPIHTLYFLDEDDVKKHYEKDLKKHLKTAIELKRNFNEISDSTDGRCNYINEYKLLNSEAFKEYNTAIILNSVNKDIAKDYQDKHSNISYI